jgi:hypothetical protein
MCHFIIIAKNCNTKAYVYLNLKVVLFGCGSLST